MYAPKYDIIVPFDTMLAAFTPKFKEQVKNAKNYNYVKAAYAGAIESMTYCYEITEAEAEEILDNIYYSEVL